MMDGYGDGTFTFSVDELRGDELLNKITFQNMPTTPKTKVMLDISSNLASASKMSIDEDGDGYEVAPILNGIVTSSDLIRIENDSQSDGDNDNHSHKKNKATSIAETRKIAPRFPIGAKLADAFIIPKTTAYAEVVKDAIDKKENRWENRMSDEKNKNQIIREIFVSLVVLFIIIIFGIRRWGIGMFKKF